MKKKDILLIGMVIFISALFSIGLSKLLFSGAQAEQETEVVPSISADFPAPDKRYFNDTKLNPTQTITIGDTTNPDPFSASQP